MATEKLKSVKVKEQTHTDLKSLGSWNESMDSIITRLLEVYNRTETNK